MPEPRQPLTRFEDIASEVDRKQQQWVYQRLPLTREQYQDLCCGLMNEVHDPPRITMDEDGEADETVIDLTALEKSKKRKM